jgi:hypothetical protein
LTVGTEWPVLQIQPSVEIVRDFSPPSLAIGLSRTPSRAKRYPRRYPISWSHTLIHEADD